MRILLMAMMAVCLGAGAWGATLPTDYFHGCDTADCSGFAHHDASLIPNVLPLGGSPELDLWWVRNDTLAGNRAGQAIGCGFYTTGCAVVYGQAGAAYLMNGGPDYPLTGDINESGFWVVASMPYWPMPWVIYGQGPTVHGTTSEVVTLDGMVVLIEQVLAVSERGDVQVLASIGNPLARGPGWRGVGYLTNVPEPGTAALVLFGAAAAMACRLRRPAGRGNQSLTGASRGGR